MTIFSNKDSSWRTFTVFLAGFLLFFIFWAQSAQAYDLPSINLGLTSFLDGSLPSGPGLYYQNYIEYYTASRFDDAYGHKLPLPRQNLDLVADVNQLTYYMPQSVGPGRFAFDVVIPTVVSARVRDGLAGAALNSQDGLGDILFAPIYQFDPISLGGGVSIMQSLEFDVLSPTGDYDPSIPINPGGHAWALDPFYSVTVAFDHKWSISARLHYLFNFTNDLPNASLGADVQTVQAGQAFHFNLAAAYAVLPTIGVGVNAYFLQQTTNTKINGVDVPGRKERVLGVGPGALFFLNKNTFVFVNTYFETLVRNRTEGSKFIIRFVHHF